MNPRMMMSQHLRRAMSCLLFLAALVVCAPSRAELQIDITKGVTDPIPVAIVPFARSVPTDAGVDATVGEGYRRGYFMVVAKDCCGTYTEEGHNAALKRMERQADVVESTELIALWSK